MSEVLRVQRMIRETTRLEDQPRMGGAYIIPTWALALHFARKPTVTAEDASKGASRLAPGTIGGAVSHQEGA